MGCTRSKLMETPWCEPITSFGWLGSQSSRIVGKWTYPWYCLRMYIRANSVWWETARENDRYHFTPKQWTEYRPWFWDTENSPIKRYAAHCQKSQVLLTWGRHMLYYVTFTILLSSLYFWPQNSSSQLQKKICHVISSFSFREEKLVAPWLQHLM